MDELEVVEQADIRAYLHVLNRRKYIIALTVLVVLGLTLAYSFVKTPTYTATATVLVPEQQASSALNIQNSQLPASDALTRALSDDQQFAKGDTVKQAAASQLGYQPNASVGMSTTADVLTFTAHSSEKQAAAAIANAYAKAFISARRANQVTQYTEQVSALQASISQLQTKAAPLSPKDPQLPILQQSINSLEQSVQQAQAASQVAGEVGPSIIDAAAVPTSASSPKPVRNGILGGVVGLILGLGFALVAERLDDGINSRDAAEAVSGGLPIVGLVPMVNSWKRKHARHLALIEDPSSNVSEAYRTVRTAIQFLSLDDPKRVIAITSSVPGEGKTTTVANLAVSFARAGQNVIVVSCDLRRPHLHEFFGDNDGRGLTSVLLGRCALSDVVHSVSTDHNLRIVPPGPIPPNPAEILSLDRVREVVDALARNADLVLLDCPPVLPVSDALLLSRLVDGMLVLASVKSTSRRDLRRTIELLNQVHCPTLGVILNKVPIGSGYSYGYDYYGHYSPSGTSDQQPHSGNPDHQDSPLGQPTISENESGVNGSVLHRRKEANMAQSSLFSGEAQRGPIRNRRDEFFSAQD
ncbi:MAG TPA: polysaccharide biosynthesis tyrosine autokinase [Acidimicrobiales bacterium]